MTDKILNSLLKSNNINIIMHQLLINRISFVTLRESYLNILLNLRVSKELRKFHRVQIIMISRDNILAILDRILCSKDMDLKSLKEKKKEKKKKRKFSLL